MRKVRFTITVEAETQGDAAMSPRVRTALIAFAANDHVTADTPVVSSFEDEGDTVKVSITSGKVEHL